MRHLLRLLIIFTPLLNFACKGKEAPVAKNGVLDLRGWDFSQDGLAPLQGEWHFYWKQLLVTGKGQNPIKANVPSRWTKYKLNNKPLPQDGWGTYKLKVLLPPGLNSSYHLGYSQNMFGAPKKIIINSKKIFKNGEIEVDSRKNTYTKKRIYFKSEILEQAGKDLNSIDIFIQSSNANGEQSGLIRYPHIGSLSYLNEKDELRVILNSILCGFFLMLSMYYFAMFLLQIEQDKYLYFSLLCLSFVLINSNLDWVELFGIDFKHTFVIGYCLCSAFPLFINSICAKENKLNKTAIIAASFTFMGPMITLIFDLWERYYFSFFAAHLVLSNVINFIFINFVTLRNWLSQKSSINFCYYLSCAIGLPFLINDILHGFLIIQSSYVLNYYFFSVVILQAFILAWGNAEAHHDVEILAAKLQDLNKDLEEKVVLRTNELGQKNQSMSKILENIHQGIFIIDENLNIEPQYSGHLTEIIGQSEIAGKHINSVFLSHTSLRPNMISQIESALMCCLGEPSFAFKLNSEHLPREIIFHSKTSEKLLEVSWEPIIVESRIDKLMVSIREVSEIRRLKEQATKSKENHRKLVEIVECGLDNFSSNIKIIDGYLNNAIEVLSQLKGKRLTKSHVDEIFRNLHTIKGNARSLQLSDIVRHTHDIEQQFHNLRKTNESSWDWSEQELLGQLDKLNTVISSYQKLFLEKLRGGINNSKESKELEHAANRLIRFLEKAKDKKIGYEKTRDIIYRNLQRLKFIDLPRLLEHQLRALKKDSIRLKKPPPHIHWGELPIWIPKEKSHIIRDVFGHLLRNTIGHGLEPASIRKKKGKAVNGTISFRVSYKENSLALEFHDDGAGLNLRSLSQKHSKRDSAIDHELAELIFKPGITTSLEVNEISGRGVGMDAVRSSLRKVGGDIHIEFIKDRDKNDHRAFKFVINLPYSIPKFLRNKTVRAA